MDKLRALSPNAYAWMTNIPRSQWSRPFFRENSKCDIISNNMSESFNNFILDARDKPILTCLELIRTKLMVRIVDKIEAMGKWNGRLCPKIVTKLERNKAKASGCWVLGAGLMEFQVDAREGQFSVHLGNNTCSCREWQISGIPCAHACAALAKNGNGIEDAVHICYTVDAFRSLYSNIIHPVRSMDQWTDIGHAPIVPPTFAPPRPGRPRKNRVRSLGEGSSTGIKVQGRMGRAGMVMHCKKCGGAGHNKRKCTTAVQPNGSQASTNAPPADAQL